ncbi:MAG: EF-Tu/IF-2/RF-3 family GTPase, partial [Candidatus Latescibacterota bacterium]
TILKSIPPPRIEPDAPPQLLVTTLQYSNYVGKIAIGRLLSGELRPGQRVAHADRHGVVHNSRIGEVYTFRNLQREPQEVVSAGNIVALSGVEAVGIGDTITDIDDPRPLPRIEVEQPTVRMTFGINTSPFAGRDGRFLTSRQIRDRLLHELEQNVALRVEDMETTGQWSVSGRGELHLAILIETMRREGYEFSVGQPEVIYHEGDNGVEEPFEEVYIEVAKENLGAVSEMLGRRRGRLTDMRHTDAGMVHCTYVVPTRGMLGFRNPFLTSTRGNGIYHTLFHEYAPFAGAIDTQDFGSLVSGDTGVTSAYSLTNLKQRGTFFIPPGTEIYDGQVIGQHIRSGDLVVNPTKRKPGTGHRAAPTGEDEQLPPHRILSLDDAIEYLNADELLEATPGSLRIRKKELKQHLREKVARKAKFAVA